MNVQPMSGDVDHSIENVYRETHVDSPSSDVDQPESELEHPGKNADNSIDKVAHMCDDVESPIDTSKQYRALEGNCTHINSHLDNANDITGCLQKLLCASKSNIHALLI